MLGGERFDRQPRVAHIGRALPKSRFEKLLSHSANRRCVRPCSPPSERRRSKSFLISRDKSRETTLTTSITVDGETAHPQQDGVLDEGKALSSAARLGHLGLLLISQACRFGDGDDVSSASSCRASECRLSTCKPRLLS
jgi:hypothetical protein